LKKQALLAPYFTPLGVDTKGMNRRNLSIALLWLIIRGVPLHTTQGAMPLDPLLWVCETVSATDSKSKNSVSCQGVAAEALA